MHAGDFRMDMLYPVPRDTRKQAVAKLLRQLSVVQAVIVMLCALMQPQFYLIPVVMIVVSEITLRMSK